MRLDKRTDIQEATDSDLESVLFVEREAFGRPVEAELVRDLLDDPSAEPRLSMLAFQDGRAVGHILFTAASLETTGSSVPAVLLAPLAVLPDAQGKGIGGQLIKGGLERLSQLGIDLVFVLGHPEYYPRYGFKPAGPLGFTPPYPIKEENADAWMVQALRPGVIGAVRGKVLCADALDRPEHW